MITVSKVRLRSKTIDDARDDYRWQMDPELARLDASTIRELSFSRFLEEYCFDLNYPLGDRREFAIENLEGIHIGNCVYYNIDMPRGEAELGIIIGEREYWGKGYGAAAISALLEHIFTRTSISRTYLKTLDWNTRARRCFEKCGFTEVGRMIKNGYSFVCMELHRSRWQAEQETKSQ
jgi:RimJ/RimL family protein N-acetyltransferase